MQAVAKREYNVKNLTPFKKGEERARKSPGRPKTVDFAAAFREYAAQGKRADQLFRDLMKKKPDVAMAHLAGKPVETQLQLTKEMDETETEKAVARIIAKGGLSGLGTQQTNAS